MTTKNQPKPRRRPGAAGAKGRKPAPDGHARPAGRRPKSAKPGVRSAGRRLRPGELDGLVIAYMREHEAALPLGPGAIAREIGRSSGAVGNCLERQADSESSPIRRMRAKPRAYDLKAEGVETAS